MSVSSPHTSGWRRIVRLAVVGAALIAGPASASAEPPPNGLRISEVWPGAETGFVELVNEGTRAVPLEGVVLTNTPLYPWVVHGTFPDSLDDPPVAAQLPAGVVLEPGERFTIALTQASVDALGLPPPGDDSPLDALLEPGQSRSLEPLLAGSTEASPWSSQSGLLVLFWWDGESDRVTDVDILRWGADAPEVDKTAIGFDGPDADPYLSTYGRDTPALQQATAPAPTTTGNGLVRIAGEVDEARRSDANGLPSAQDDTLRDDETSEDWSRSFGLTARPTPGAPNQVAWRVTGRVTDAAGEALEGAVVTIDALGKRVESDVDGAFDLGTLPVGEHRAEAATSDGRSASRELAVVDGDVDIVLVVRRAGHLRGTVSLEGARPPALSGTRISIPTLGREVQTDADGDYVIDDLPTRTLEVVFAREDYVELRRQVRVGPRTTLDVDLSLSGGGAVTVRLRSSGGPIPVGASVSLFDVDNTGRSHHETTGTGTGEVRFEGVTTGRYAISFEAPGFEGMRVGPVHLQAGDTVVLQAAPAVSSETSDPAVGCTSVGRARGTSGVWVVCLFSLILAVRLSQGARAER